MILKAAIAKASLWDVVEKLFHVLFRKKIDVFCIAIFFSRFTDLITLRAETWFHCLFFFPLALGKM